MSDVEIIRKKIDELEELAEEIEHLGQELIEEAEIQYRDVLYCYHWKTLPSNLRLKQREALRKYQRWYFSGRYFIQEYLPEEESQFNFDYDIGSDRINGVKNYLEFQNTVTTDNKSVIFNDFWQKFENQRSTLLVVPAVLEVKALSLRETISANFVEREIDEAEYLYKHDHIRAAGALAGVALEMRLRTICDTHAIDYGHKDTIEPLVQKLYKNNKIEISELKRIQYLASIRDKCDHPSDVNKGEVKELIEKVKKFVAQPV